jgi:hypothetical protein
MQKSIKHVEPKKAYCSHVGVMYSKKGLATMTTLCKRNPRRRIKMVPLLEHAAKQEI